jgi:hypothetical protein
MSCPPCSREFFKGTSESKPHFGGRITRQTSPRLTRRRHRFEHRSAIADPAENAALGLDHFQAHLVKFRKIGRAAVGQHDTAIATVVALAHRGVNADLRRDPADQQVLDGVPAQHGAEAGSIEGALARLVDDDLARERVERRNDVMSGFSADEDSSHRAGIADAKAGRAAKDRASAPRGYG